MGFFDKLFGGNKARKEELEKLQEDYRRLRALNAQHALARRRPGSEESNQPGSRPLLDIQDEQLLEMSQGFQRPDFDGTKFALERLLPEVSQAEGKGAQERFSRILERWERVRYLKSKDLIEILTSNYSQLVDGMAQVQDVKADLDATHALCGSCRVQLRAVDQEVVEGSLRIIQLQRRLKNMQRLFDIVNKILEYGKGQNRVEAMLEQGDFSGAVSRIMLHQEWLAQLKGLKCMRSEDMGTAKMLENQTREVKKSIHKQLCEFYRKFSESCYEASLRGLKDMGESEESIVNSIRKFAELLINRTVTEIAKIDPAKKDTAAITRCVFCVCLCVSVW